MAIKLQASLGSIPSKIERSRLKRTIQSIRKEVGIDKGDDMLVY